MSEDQHVVAGMARGQNVKSGQDARRKHHQGFASFAVVIRCSQPVLVVRLRVQPAGFLRSDALQYAEMPFAQSRFWRHGETKAGGGDLRRMPGAQQIAAIHRRKGVS